MHIMSLSSPELDLKKYLEAREALIAQDRSLRRDHQEDIRPIRPESGKQTEAKELWENAGNEISASQSLFPGMGFLTGNNSSVEIFRILKKMPKGGLLHAHLDAMVDAEKLLNWALTLGAGYMHVRVDEPITASNFYLVVPEFKALVPGTTDNISLAPSLMSPSYLPKTWVPLHVARRPFSLKAFLMLKNLRGPELFDAWVTASIRIDPSEAYENMNTVDKIWDRFRAAFRTIFGLFRFEPIFRAVIKQVFWDCLNDGISYAELRINFHPLFMVRADGREDFGHREWVLAIREILDEFREELKPLGRQEEFVGVKLIYTTFRLASPEEIQFYLDDCFELKKEFQDEIAGFDLVGQEDLGEPLIKFVEVFLKFQKRVQEAQLYLPFIFHAGETLSDGGETDLNLIDALLLGTKRIGHGFSIAKHPHLLQMCREKNIMLEVCPISCRLTSSMPMHPLPAVLNSGVPVALNCDDPGIFDSMGNTYDIFQVLIASDVSGLTTIGTIAYDSLQFSELQSEKKVQALEFWKKRWAAFIDAIVDGSI
ncbi:Metallo-dependent hydrolase [Cantharellus anzutake]|uniref:Metallo-dependent hydrolase n=1 Tax=Cantharellus anzutake TaxID=1750568 RepID=UPI0019063586|nr:Metallo-dependent hydrolase [Cantharellus anzutake]KAF8333951.1 Metallo-dependent hydrolase [Cantharellus anzutake]